MVAKRSALQAAMDLGEMGRDLGQQVDVVQHHMFGQRGAIMSPCGKYRWLIWETWSLDPFLGMNLLNPSTASHLIDDPTWVRGRRRAVTSRTPTFGGLLLFNSFAYRATDPADMKASADPIGSLNDAFIDAAIDASDRIICGWGAHGGHLGRDEQMKARMRAKGVTPYILSMTKGGHPGHPLYLKEALQPVPWDIG
ncbi:MAG: DUF1643 domain-containing protein [Sphingomonadales bacterium]|nr:DUF1643 domain-containing protein [Sphingomonadales bacterium]